MKEWSTMAIKKGEEYTKVPNSFLAHMAQYGLSGEEWKILIVLIRKSWGWNKNSAVISLNDYTKETYMHRFAVVRAIKKLVQKNIVKKIIAPGHHLVPFLTSEYLINLNFTEYMTRHKSVTGSHFLVTRGSHYIVPKASHKIVSSSNMEEVNFKKREKEGGRVEFFDAYSKIFNENMGGKPELTRPIKETIKKIVDDLGLEKAKEYLNSYFKINDPWFLKRNYDLETFYSNINKIKLFHETGLLPGQYKEVEIESAKAIKNIVRLIKNCEAYNIPFDSIKDELTELEYEIIKLNKGYKKVLELIKSPQFSTGSLSVTAKNLISQKFKIANLKNNSLQKK